MRNEADRAVRVVQDSVCHTAERRADGVRTPTGSDNDQVGIGSYCNQHLWDRPCANDVFGHREVRELLPHGRDEPRSRRRLIRSEPIHTIEHRRHAADVLICSARRRMTGLAVALPMAPQRH